MAHFEKDLFWKLRHFEKTAFENWINSKYGSLRKLLISEIGPLRNMAHFEKKLILKIKSLRNMDNFENESFRESGHFGNWVLFSVLCVKILNSVKWEHFSLHNGGNNDFYWTNQGDHYLKQNQFNSGIFSWKFVIMIFWKSYLKREIKNQ